MGICNCYGSLTYIMKQQRSFCISLVSWKCLQLANLSIPKQKTKAEVINQESGLRHKDTEIVFRKA